VPGPKNVVADTLSLPPAIPPPPATAPVQKSTLKNSQTDSGTGTIPNLDPRHITVQKSTIKNILPESGSKNNTDPDPLQVVANVQSFPPIDYGQMADLQLTCTECTQMCNSTVLFVVTRKIGDTALRGDISRNVFRPLVPVALREAVIRSMHNVAHPGVEATVRLVSAKFCWPKMAKQVRLFAQNCVQCQKAKVSTHVHLAPSIIPVPQRRFEHIHVDLVGPLPPSSGYSYLFTVVDRTTRWPEAIPISGISATECAAALFTGWIQRFSVPAYITSDRGGAVHVLPVAGLVHLVVNHTHPNNGVPSPIKWFS
jgi:hypothetical protein